MSSGVLSGLQLADPEDLRSSVDHIVLASVVWMSLIIWGTSMLKALFKLLNYTLDDN